MFGRHTHSTTSLKLIDNELSKHNLSLAQVLSELDPHQRKLMESKTRVPLEVFLEFQNKLESCTKDPLFMVKTISKFPRGHYNALEFLIGSSKTFGSALKNLARYVGVINSSMGMEAHRTQDKLIGQFLWLATQIPEPANQSEIFFSGVIHRMNLWLDQPVYPERVCFKHAPRVAISEYETTFKTTVEFGCFKNQLVWPADLYELAMPRHDGELGKTLQSHLDQVISESSIYAGIAKSVEDVVIRNLSSGDVQAKMVAEELGISVRSLNRKLNAENTSFQKILSQTRQAIAEKYLAGTGMSIEEISFLIVFSDRRSFERAFRQWTGQTPTSFRQSAAV